MPMFGSPRDDLGPDKESDTNKVRRINIKLVSIGVAVAVVVIASTVFWLVKNRSGERILAGKVIDASTNKGIKGARVYLENAEGASEVAVTDSEGGFSIDVKEETNTVRFLVRAEGFRRHTGLARLSPGTTLIEVRLNPI